MNRRNFLRGMAGILSAGYSASVLPGGVIMPIRQLWTPNSYSMTVRTEPYYFNDEKCFIIDEITLISDASNSTTLEVSPPFYVEYKSLGIFDLTRPLTLR